MNAYELVSILLEDAHDEPFDLKWDSNGGEYVDVVVDGHTLGTLMLDHHRRRWVFSQVFIPVDRSLDQSAFREPEQGARLLYSAYARSHAPRAEQPAQYRQAA